MTKLQAVKLIRRIDNFIGLPRAIEIYNYLSCYGVREVSENDIIGYLSGCICY